ncbi:serine/threonine-protein kinase [Aeromicrobium massiliense]|uniref:serine/threonine-protein kinase n=1 Tax=Aeromicrobium massiliense TaxID=1464554 RepID=UPI0002E395FC|nr:serine/threonine-protein kinase [Aeromicrobium massiliense]
MTRVRSIGRYRLDSVRGSGAFATVWQGFDTELDIPVAVKVLADNWTHHADVRERFLAEARLLRRVESDRVVRVHDTGVHDGRPFFVMDLAEGGTLEARAGGSLDAVEALRLAAEAARSVAVLHDVGVVHRDVKPSNFLLRGRGDGRVIVADLGSAKRLAEASGITVTTGTPSFMAPEQALGRGVDARCDVYALGVLAYVLLTGSLPFDVRDPYSLVTRTESDRPPRLAPEHLPRRVDADTLDGVLAKATALDPARRFGSATDLADALEHVADGGRARHGERHVSPAIVWSAACGLFGLGAGVVWRIL